MRISVRTRDITAWAMAVILVGGVAACGGEANSGSPEGSATFTGEPVTVMTVAPVNTQLINHPDVFTIAEAAVDTLNKAGGLGGHKVNLITCNERQDTNAAAACAREAVSSKAIAVVGGNTTNGASIVPILKAANIPWIGPPGFSAPELDSDNSYMLLAGSVAFAGVGQKAAKDGCEEVITIFYDTPATDGVNELVATGVEAGGGSGVELVKIPRTTTDFSSIAKSGAQGDCVIAGMPAQQSAALAKAGRALNLETNYYMLQLDDTTAKAAGGALEGAQSVTNFPTIDNPAWKTALEAAPELDLSNPYTQNTWVSYQVLADALKGETDISAATVTAGLKAATDETAGGLMAPTNFSKPFPVPGLSRVFNRNLVFIEGQGDKVVQVGSYTDVSSLFGVK